LLPGDDGKLWTLRWVSGAIQRLFALSLTATFVLGFVTAAMDIIGWQYARGFVELGHKVFGNGEPVGWLSFLGWSWLNHPNLQFLATSLIPLAAVLLVWILGYSTWRRLEAVNGHNVHASGLLTPLEDRRTWNGIGPVARLRAVHVSFGLAIVGLSLLAPLLLSSQLGTAQIDLTASFWGWVALITGIGLCCQLVVLVGIVSNLLAMAVKVLTRLGYELASFS
jgi:hypothetical protein